MKAPPATSMKDPPATNPNVKWFSYQRGLDGDIPGEADRSKQPDSNAAPKPGIGNILERSTMLEAPVGDSQFDYIRRLAERLKRWNQELIAKQTRGLSAIGVLGSDVYDKLLVMQALRKEFPGVLFFTTDLDARLSYSQESSWSHNLIVGSSFGLSLADEYQDKIPPFRHQYQTAAFYAVLHSLNVDPKLSAVGRDEPRIFEIGRGSAYDLSAESNSGIHPSPSNLDTHILPRTFVWAILMVASGLAAFIYLIPSLRPQRPIHIRTALDLFGRGHRVEYLGICRFPYCSRRALGFH